MHLMNDKRIDLSIVVPLKDEEANIEPLAAEIANALCKAGFRWECIWVDDGSRDNTLFVLKALHGKDPRHRYIFLNRNYGQSAALTAGLRHASGFIIATLDGDGQNDPADLQAMLATIETGEADMVTGVRIRRMDSLVRRLSSRVANEFRNRLTGDSVSDAGCAVRVFRRECLEDLHFFKGMHRFLPTLVRMKGWKVKEMPVNHRPRLRGKTKYGINNRLWVGLLDTLAIRWMKMRMINFQVEEVSVRRD